MTDSQASDTHIGTRIRELRKAKRLTIAQLSKLSGFSVGYISQIERAISEVPISTLKPIAQAMGVQISWFFHQPHSAPESERGYIVRRAHRALLNFSGSGISETMLSPNLSGQSLLIISEIQPGCSDPNTVTRPVEESGLVMEGSLELCIGQQTFLLHSGDSFVIPKHTPHRIGNPTEQLSKTLWIITPPNY